MTSTISCKSLSIRDRTGLQGPQGPQGPEGPRGPGPELHFSDISPLAVGEITYIPTLSGTRYIGQGNTSNLSISEEHAFFNVAYIVCDELAISEIRVAIKNVGGDELLITPVDFTLYRSVCGAEDEGVAGTYSTPEALVTSTISVPSTTTEALCQVNTFDEIILNPGDLVAVRVDPGTNDNMTFRAAASVC